MPGDPERLGAYTLRGRLGEGGQGVVYLGEDASGEQFAIKWLRADLAADPVSRERFLREVAAAQRVAAFCTAQVVATGLDRDRPYIVGEYIAGPSLQTLVTGSGPRGGPDLHRLAVGTATALTAIHQAGIVHRDFKPANVLMAADGPRVIDFGIAKALDGAATLTSRPVGTPSYMAPEQLAGESAGPPADMFSWAGTILFAATGEAPFGSDTLPAVLHRIMTVAPDLNVLHGALREAVAACLAKEPARRPTAEQVLLRLLHSTTGPEIPHDAAVAASSTSGSLPPVTPAPVTPPPGTPPSGTPPAGPPTWATPTAAPEALASATPPPSPPPAPPSSPPPPPPSSPPPPPMPPPPPGPPGLHGPRGPYRVAGGPPMGPPTRSSGRKVAVAGAAVGVALALTVVGVYLAMDGSGTVVTEGSPSPGVTGPAVTSPGATTPTPPRAVPTSGLVETKLPDVAATAYEHPGDPISLAYFHIERGDDWINYPRTSRTGPFTRTEKYWTTTVSPDRALRAGRPKRYTARGYHAIDIIDPRTGQVRSIDTVKAPLTWDFAEWSKDGRRLLLTMRDDRKNGATTGFIVVDVAAGTAKTTALLDAAIADGRFYWAEGETTVATAFADGEGTGLRFYGLDGKMTREISGIGRPYNTTTGLFSPSGRSFVTDCPIGVNGDCVWDTATGDRKHVISSACARILGWYDESHLFCWATTDGRNDPRVIVIDLRGTTLRVLLKTGPRDVIGLHYVREDDG